VIDVLQELVEALAQTLKRSVAVDDVGLRLLASSAHFEDVDPARMGSLVGRRVSGAVRDHVMRAGVQNWHEPKVLPAEPELGLALDRLCFPLRSKYELLGFMWLLDDGTLEQSEIALGRESADRIQDLLVRKVQSEVDVDFEIEAIVQALLAGDFASRKQAAEDLRDLGLFQRAEVFSVVVVTTKQQRPRPPESTVRDAVRRAFAQATQGHLRDLFAYSVGSNHSLLVVGHRAEPSHAQRVAAAQAVHEAMDRFAPEVAAISAIGTSEMVDRLSRVHEAFDQASTASEVALSQEKAIAVWDENPLECLLRSWLRPRLAPHMVPTVIGDLMRQPEETIRVVEAFLDAGGNAATVASSLHLHRTTVYYRLNRLKENLGIDLNDGPTRLLVHLWLKGRHFSGS
jgi:hypothetical protein